MSEPFEQTPEGSTLGELLARLVEEGLSADESQRLCEVLERSAEAREYYTRYLETHSALEEQWGTPMPLVLPDHADGRPASVAAATDADAAGKISRGWFSPARWAAAAALMLLAGMAVWLSARTQSAVTVEVLGGDAAPQFVGGQRLSLRQLSLASGTLQFRLESGAVVEASGPAEIELRDAMHLRVLRGNVTADVGDKARGFVIETVNARVLDLGTRFGVSVGRSGDTDVVVFEGKVEVFDPSRKSSGQSALASLTEGDAVRMNAARIPERLSSVPMRADSRALAAQSSPGIVTAVTDNFGEKGFHRYYGVAAGAMQDNARAYTTMTRAKWHAVAGTTFPEELRGADVVATFHENRKDRDLHIRLEVSAPCAVYVLFDARGQVPGWVQAGWRDTGIRLRSGPWNSVPIVRDIAPDADGNLYVTCAVWRKDISSAGVVELGPPYAKRQPSNRAMYGIAVQAKK